MTILGKTYFWKFVRACEPDFLDEFGADLRTTLSEVSGKEYRLVPPDPGTTETIRRWSKGSFNEPNERILRFPRLAYSYRPSSGDDADQWIAVISFTRVPHVTGVYSHRGSDHVLTPSIERELGARLVESYHADVFTRMSAKTFIGTTSGLYLYEKVHHIRRLKAIVEDSKYVPPSSDLNGLLELLPAVLAGGQPSSPVIEIRNTHAEVKRFLQGCDDRVLGVLGEQRVGDLLKPVEVSVKEWRDAGTRGLFRTLLPRLSQIVT
jgi:hypothetical protein